MVRTIYIISGPAGAGKSTTSKKIADRLAKSAYIEGDLIDHMVIGGHEKPWISQYHTDLIWRNILSITGNFIDQDHDVVIDYVAFMHSAEYIAMAFQGREVSVKFVVLVTDEEELLRRDAERLPHARMGQRCIEGLKEILQTNPPENHIINTTHRDVDFVVDEIMSRSKFLVLTRGSE